MAEAVTSNAIEGSSAPPTSTPRPTHSSKATMATRRVLLAAAAAAALFAVCASAQLDIGDIPIDVLSKVAPQDTLSEVCEDDRFKIILKSICDPDGEVAQRIKTATPARVPMTQLTLDHAMDTDQNVFYAPVQNVREMGEGEGCEVNVQNLKLVRTSAMYRESQSREGQLEAGKNDLVLSALDRINEDVSRFIAAMQNDDDDDRGGAESTVSSDHSVYTVFSESPSICARGLQCVVAESDLSAANGTSGYNVRGTCEACKSGNYCPEGAVNDETGVLRFQPSLANQCPRGYFCPNPSTIKNCPVGLFCPPGSSKPLDCSDLAFNLTQNLMTGTTFKAELIGNYCPMNTPEPWGLCPARYYCPNASLALPCPPGHYCPPMSPEPRKCPSMSNCPTMSLAPSTSWMALVGIAVIAALVYGVALLIVWRNKTTDDEDNGEEGVALFNEKIIKTICGIVLPEYKARDISDVFRMGTLSLVSDPLRLDIKNLTVKFKKRTILDGVNLTFPKGTLNAIFGPSGAGKTTVIKSMLGKLSYDLNITGKVSFTKCVSKEEIVVYSSNRSFLGKVCDFFETSQARKKVIQTKVGYVPQDNVVYPNLTVRENILFSVKLRNKVVTNRKALSDQILNLLDLFSARNTIVGSPEKGGISGGECRRVSIGLELAGSPLCLVLDEPTTGLDAVSADRVLKCLNFLTNSGMTIIASIHQPKSSIFHLFAHIHVLMKGGFVVYTGPKDCVSRYFAHLGFLMPELENPADFVIDVVSGLVNCENNPSFTAEDLSKMWTDNQEMLETFAKFPSDEHSSVSSSSFVDRKNQEDYMEDQEIKCMLSSALPDLQKELLSNQELNSGMNTYALSMNELKTLMIQICSACCHLKYFDSVEKCVKHVSDKIYVCLSPEMNPQAEQDGEEDFNTPRSLKSMLSFKSARKLLSSFGSRGKNDYASPRASSRVQTMGRMVASGLKRNANLLCVLYTKDVLGWVRSLGLKTVDFITTAVFAVILGFNQGQGNMEVKDVMYMSMLTNLYVGMLSVVWAVSLMLERLKSAQREAGGSISTGMIFTSAKLMDLLDHVLRPTIFSVLFYYISLPRMSFFEFYAVILGISLSCSGLGDLIAVIFPENLATVAGLIIAFALGGIMNGFSPALNDLPSEWIVFPSFARWGVEILCLAEFRQYDDWQTLTGMHYIGYNFDNWKWGLSFLYVSAVVFRVVAYPLFRKRALF